MSKTSHLKLKCEVSRTEKKVQECDYVFGSSTTFQRRKEWICESRCRQVSVRLRVFAGFFYPYTLPRLQFMLGLHFTPACVLLLVCSLHFTHSLHFTPGPQSAVRSLRFTLTDIGFGMGKEPIFSVTYENERISV